MLDSLTPGMQVTFPPIWGLGNKVDTFICLAELAHSTGSNPAFVAQFASGLQIYLMVSETIRPVVLFYDDVSDPSIGFFGPLE